MTEPAWVAVARELRADDLSFRQIARRIGVSRQTVRYWLVPGEKARMRARGREWRDRPGVREQQNKRRRDSRRAGYAPSTRRAEEADAAARQVVAWWAEGLTTREIAERLGIREDAAYVRISKLRKRGYDLPYRRRSTSR